MSSKTYLFLTVVIFRIGDFRIGIVLCVTKKIKKRSNKVQKLIACKLLFIYIYFHGCIWIDRIVKSLKFKNRARQSYIIVRKLSHCPPVLRGITNGAGEWWLRSAAIAAKVHLALDWERGCFLFLWFLSACALKAVVRETVLPICKTQRNDHWND